MSTTTKQLKVKVTTAAGERTLLCRPTNAPVDHYVCEVCPYEKVCEHLPNPAEPENKDTSFVDFCSTIRAPEGSGIDCEVCPAPGTIEENLGDLFDINSILIKKDPFVKMRDIIDKACSGWCEDYDPSYCNCKSSNYSCIMKNLFQNLTVEFPVPPEPEEETKEEDSAATGIGVGAAVAAKP